MPVWEPPPGASRARTAAFSVAAVVGIVIHLVAGCIWLIGAIVVVPDRPEDQLTLDLVRAGLAAAWVAMGGAFLIGWYFLKTWTLLLPFVALALVWFGLQIVPGHAGIGDPWPSG